MNKLFSSKHIIYNRIIILVCTTKYNITTSVGHGFDARGNKNFAES